MKHTPAFLTLIVAASALAQTAPTPAPAKSDWTQTHNLALATDYIFRGVTQIGGDGIALSGGTDLTHASGFSLGLWAANVSFAATEGSGLELDVYAGYSKTFGDFTASVGLISYHYEGIEAANTTEAYVGIAAHGFTIKYSSSLTDYFGLVNSDGVGYLSLGYTLAVPGIKDLTAGFSYGATTAEGAQEAYNDFKVSVSYPLAGYTASLAYTDVSGNEDVGATNPALKAAVDEIVLSFSRTF